MKQKLAAWMVGGMVVILLVVVFRGRPAKTAAREGTPALRPNPLDDRLPQLPLKIVDVPGETVRTRTAETQAPPTKPRPESFDKISGSNWAVVAAIYKDYEAAERRAQSMAANAKFKPSVFPEKGQGDKYMVVLGTGLTRTKAEELRLQATGAGLPTDTYVTKLNP
jgi:hypothetical protein